MMKLQYTPFMLPSAIAAVVSFLVMLAAWRRRPAPGALPLALLNLAITWWALWNIVELTGANIPTKFLGLQVQYPGVVAVPLWWLIFALDYTGRSRWLTRRNLILLALLPVITIILVFTNSLHGWMWSTVGLDARGPYLALDLAFGVWWWIVVAYTYPMILAGTALFVLMFMRSLHLYRQQAAAILLGLLAPWVSNAIFILGLNPVPHWDLTPFAFSLTGLCMAWGLFHFRMLDIMPVARDTVIEGMADGMLVLDMQNRVVDLNPAAQRMVGCSDAQAVGQPAELMLSTFANLVEHYRDMMTAQAEIVLGEGQAARDYDLRISLLTDRRGHATGRVVVLRDITQRKQVEAALLESERQIEDLYRREQETAQQLQQSLLPAAAPQIRGLDIAGFSQSAQQVGGDFYNYFLLGAERLGIAVGDVSGKGMQAALTMALSVGLLTTEVDRQVTPAALLPVLNMALRSHARRNKMNTALGYLTLERTDGGWTLCTANAGVIAPLVRHADGSVEWLNVGGLPLGVEIADQYTEVRRALVPGDVLIMSSDGIVEAMNDKGELYSFERLAGCVASAPCRNANEIVECILSDVHAFTSDVELHDDMTLVVVVIREE